MLKVTVLFFASYREQAKTTVTMVEVPEGSNLARVIDVVCESYPNIKCPSQNIVAAINEEYKKHSTIITQGDTIALIPPVSGG
jgi:molybdopterin converting factor subunit 1